MMSADVKVSIRQQEIKDLVVHLTIIYKSYLQNLKYNVKSGCIFHLILVGILSISILYIIRPQSINYLVCVSFAPKNGAGWQAEAKKFGFFEKKQNIYCQSVTEHVLLNRCSSNYQYIIKIKVKKFVFIPLFLGIYILLCYDLFYLSVLFFYG